MKVRDMIETQIKDLAQGGLVPRYIALTPRALEVLLLEVAGEDGLRDLDRTRADGTVLFRSLEVVVVPYMNRFTPICVVGAVQEEMDVHQLKVKKERDAGKA